MREQETVWVRDYGMDAKQIVVAKRSPKFVYEAAGTNYKGTPRFNRYEHEKVFATKREVLASIVELAQARVERERNAFRLAEEYLARCIERLNAEPES